MSKYTSILKSATDLLQKPFNYDHKVELKTKADNGAVFTSDASISGKDGKAAANIKAEYKKGNFKVDKVTIGTKKVLVGEFSLAEAAPGVDASFKFSEGTRSADAKNTATLGCVYTRKSEQFDSVVTADAELINGVTIDATGLVNYKKMLFGASAKVATGFGKGEADGDSSPLSLTDYNGLIGYRAADFTLAAETSKSASKVTLSLVHNSSKNLSAGFMATFDRVQPEDAKKAVPVDVTLGGQYKLDDTATVSGAAASAGTVSIAYKQKMNSIATLTASAQVDALNLGSDKHKFGLTIALAN